MVRYLNRVIQEVQIMRLKMKELRVDAGYTQLDISKQLRVSRSHYSQIEAGIKQPSLLLGIRIKWLLKHVSDDIFDDIPESQPHRRGRPRHQ